MNEPTTVEAEPWAQGPTLVASVWRYKWTILTAALLAAGLGYFLSSSQAPTYEATARIFLADPRNQSIMSNARVYADPVQYVPQQAERVTSDPVLDLAAQFVGGGATGESLAKRVATAPDPELNLISVTAVASTPTAAADIANAVTEAYEQVSRQQELAKADAAVAELEGARQRLRDQIAGFEAELAARPEDLALITRLEVVTNQLAALDERAQGVAVDAAVFGSGVDLTESAEIPESPASPKPIRNAVLAGVLAFALAAAWAYWRAARTQRVESRFDPARVLGVPLLGQIPRFRQSGGGLGRGSGDTPIDIPPEAAEAYRFLLTSVEFSLDERGGSSVLITSAGEGDGKTLTAAGMARAAAVDGRDTLLVDADVRARGLSRLVGIDRLGGLTDLIRDSVEDLDRLLRVPFLAEGVKVRVLSAGTRVDDPGALLRSPGFRRASKHLREAASLVIVDAPPLLAVADTSVIAGHVDAILLVVNRGTSLSQLQHLRERLAFVSTPVLGYVYNRASSGRGGMGYGYGYDEAPEPKLRAGRGAGSSRSRSMIDR